MTIPADLPMLGQQMEVAQVVDFILAHHPQALTREQAEEIVLGHAQYGTYMVLFDGTPPKIIACARWNFDGPYAVVILDAIIHPDYTRRGIIRLMLKNGLATHPWVTTIKWERAKKHPFRAWREYHGPFFARHLIKEAV